MTIGWPVHQLGPAHVNGDRVGAGHGSGQEPRAAKTGPSPPP